MIRVADFIMESLADHGVRDVFLVTGGGAMHLNDAIGRCKRLHYVCCHHEQACSMAAESYGRLTNRPALVNVTTGPGGTNAITGVYDAWVDSISMIVISGQVKWTTCAASTPLRLRQLGDQEGNIIGMVTPITKYAVLVRDPNSIRYHLEKALHLATSGRPGPCWIDVPLDVQGALVNPDELEGYDPAEDPVPGITGSALEEVCQRVVERLRTSKRPVLYAGQGIRLAGAHDRFVQLAEHLKIPVVTPWNSHDLIWNGHPCYVGRPGLLGDRAGNFAVQNSDFLLSIGCRLSVRQVGYSWKTWARGAYKVMVDIDDQELQKPTLKIDLPIHADAGAVIDILNRTPFRANAEHGKWLDWCQERRRRYPVVQKSYWDDDKPVNPYCFVDALFAQLPEDEIIVTGNGSACVIAFQAACLKRGQRLYHNSGSAPMGFDLPGAIGAAVAVPDQRVVCVTGDGSIQMNIQELQTIVEHRFPIKIFLINNRGYHSIRQTQQAFFPDSPIGYEPGIGVSFPSFEKVASAYGIPYRRCTRHAELTDVIRTSLGESGPQVCEVMVDEKQKFAPKISSKRLDNGQMISPPLEDMAPFLDREELCANMIIPPLAA